MSASTSVGKRRLEEEDDNSPVKRYENPSAMDIFY